jgi:FTR1 family protein
MVPVFIVAFREFLEAFLSVGVLLGISYKFQLGRTKSILGGSIVGFIVVFILATVVFGTDSSIIKHLPKDSFDLIEGWLFTLSSIFVAYAVFTLHKILSHYSQEDIKKIEGKVKNYKASYWLLPFTAFLLVLKEGSEGIFFNVTNGLFYMFDQDLTGFGLAFIAAMLCGLIIQKFFSFVSLKRIFRITEVFIIFVGVDAITEGLETLATYYFHVDISDYDMLIALLYVIFVYEVFIREGKKPEAAVNIVKEDLKLVKSAKRKSKKRI